jgi:hypothetical protein
LSDLYQKRKHGGGVMSEAEITAKSERSGGTLLASGLIAGGALAGIINAFMGGVLAPLTDRITRWSTAHNPLFFGSNSDALSLLPFAVLIVLLALAGCDRMFARD